MMQAETLKKVVHIQIILCPSYISNPNILTHSLKIHYPTYTDNF